MAGTKENMLSMLGADSYKVFIRKAGKYKFQSNYKFEKHRHSEIEINYINTGCCVMGIDNEYVPLKAGDCIVIYPYVTHSFMVDMSKACSITQLEYSVAIPEKHTETLSFLRAESSYLSFTSCDNLCKALENVCRNFREQSDEDEYSSVQLDFAMAQLYMAFESRYNKMKKEQTPESQGVVGEVIRYINQHIEEDLNLEAIAERFHVSDRYIRKYSQKYLGMNCMKYISMLRIAKAKEMLWNSDKSITEIAMQTGFSSSQYFSRVFHKYTEMTPMEYRTKWRGTIAEVSDEV